MESENIARTVSGTGWVIMGKYCWAVILFLVLFFFIFPWGTTLSLRQSIWDLFRNSKLMLTSMRAVWCTGEIVGMEVDI